jgi:hypothetical protein
MVIEGKGNGKGKCVYCVRGVATIILGNASDKPIEANLRYSSGQTEKVLLGPFATEVIDYRNNGSNPGGTADSLRIEATGTVGSLRATGLVRSNNKKVTSAIRFYDPQNIRQQHLFATNLRLSRSKNCTVDCLVCGCLCETKHSADNAPLVKGLVPGPWLKTEGLPQTRPLYGTCRDATDSGSISGKFGSTETAEHHTADGAEEHERRPDFSHSQVSSRLWREGRTR